MFAISYYFGVDTAGNQLFPVGFVMRRVCRDVHFRLGLEQILYLQAVRSILCQEIINVASDFNAIVRCRQFAIEPCVIEL